MVKCETKFCRNESSIIVIGKHMCIECWDKKCADEEKAWMEKQWNRTLTKVGL